MLVVRVPTKSNLGDKDSLGRLEKSTNHEQKHYNQEHHPRGKCAALQSRWAREAKTYTRVYKGIQGYLSSSESTSKMQQSRAEAGLLMLAPHTCNIIDVLTVAHTY